MNKFLNLLGIKMISRFNKKNPYTSYKQHCSTIRAVLSADPGFVNAMDRHDHIVEQRIILNQLIK
jgi:hypothetical protein